MVSSILTSIVTVVAVAAVMRVIVGFRDGRVQGRSPRSALIGAISVLIVPTSWSCVTDALGFGSLLVAEVGPVRDFGLMTTVGCLWALVALVLVMPGLALAGNVDPDPRRAWGEDRLDAVLIKLTHWVERRPAVIATITILVTAFLAAGAARIDVETDFTKNFRADSPTARSYDFVERRLGGAGMCDVVIPAPAVLDEAYLARLRRLTRRLRTQLGADRTDGERATLTGVLSIVDVIDVFPGRNLYLITRAKLSRFREQSPQLYRSLFAEDPDEPGRFYCRIMLRARERESATAKRELIAAIERIAAEEFPASSAPHGGEPEVTGYYALLTKMIDSVLRDQWYTFAVSAASIAVVLVIAFRSLGFAVAAMVPNLLPVFAVLGLLGWSGLKMNMGAAMIAAVSLGLSVNSSIHYIAIFDHARRRGKSLAAALDEAQQSIGRASVFATLALVIGFSALCLSEFVPTVYFGALVALALCGGLLGNLIILPLLLAGLNRPSRGRESLS
jgi:predicted RND superfamily exporter protein